MDASLPSSNFDSKSYLYSDGSPTKTTYLKFEVSDIPATPVRLRVFAESASSVGVATSTVADNGWTETGIKFENAPALGPVVANPVPIKAGSWIQINLSSVITAPGTYSFALTTPSSTGIKFTSGRGLNKPHLVFGDAPSQLSPFQITKQSENSYTATAANGMTYTGSLKVVGEKAVTDLDASGGGTINFTAGTFNFGTEYFKLSNVADVIFAGAGRDQTIIQNSTSAAADTEPFNFSGAEHVVIKNLTVSAGGPARSTSDAIDFDKGNNSTVENVAITASRGRAIVFDGKNAGWTADHNTVRDCIIDGVPSQGIEFLASSDNTVSGCTISNTGGIGIQAGKASSTADQPNKKSSRNIISGNTITEAGRDGILVNSGDENQILNNTVTNSSDDVTSRDGIRIQTSDTSITCDGNIVSGNTATDTQTTKTQRYGLLINNPECHGTRVSGNTLSGNKTAPYKDLGTGTIFQ